MLLEALGVFVCMIVLDFAWGRYVLAMHLTAVKAANWSVVLSTLSGIMSIAFVHDPWLLIPGAAGAWIGTYLSKVDFSKI